MKALSLAAGLAIALVGTACSQEAPVDPETVQAETDAVAEASTPETSQPSRSRFNLRVPGGDPVPPAQTDSGFNLRTPDAPAPNGMGINLPATPPQSTTLDQLPEVQTPTLNNPAGSIAAEVDTPELEPEDDPDAIIRLD
ncbi:hypothetical protein [Henriciella marina]|uniref:hypothetical protein n=1 Tax=Henriciella marina TaxID=453851 RepID=UPI00039E5E2D|nr:hypothetical protein [Henriciella marina]